MKSKFQFYNTMCSFSVLLLTNSVNCDLLDNLGKAQAFSAGFLKPVADYIVKHPKNSTVQCVDDIILWQKNLTNTWALQMHDANGKLPPGILTLNLHTLGQYDECLSVEGFESGKTRIKGKYCMAKIPLNGSWLLLKNNEIFNYETLNRMKRDSERIVSMDDQGRFVFNWAVCFPASCKAEEIQSLLRDTIESVLGVKPSSVLTVPERYFSESKPLQLNGGAIALIVVASILAVVVFSSTMYDLYSRQCDKEHGRLHSVLISFSAYTNSKKLTKVNKNNTSLRCVHGIRVLSILWIIFGHRYITILFTPNLNSSDILKWIDSYESMMIIAGSVGVDTFFVLSGLLLAYVFFQRHKNKKSFNLPLFYLHRIVRLWPPMAAIVFAQATIYGYIGSGPYWRNICEILEEPCKKYWWTALLYVQNYVNPLELCVPQMWYLSIDMQLYILSPVLIYPLLKKAKLGIVNLILWIAVAQTLNATFVFTNEWSASSASTTGDNDDYSINYYQATYMRATPWVLGFAAGYLLFRTSKKEIKINKIIVVFSWLVSLAIMAAVVFGFKPLQAIDHEINLLEDGTYNAFARTTWGVCVIWMIFACVHGYGGPINWFLSLRLWEILGRFTYSMYLLHFSIQFWRFASSKVAGEFSHLSLVYGFFGDLLMTILFSYVWILTFESPFLALENALLGKPIKREVKPEEDKK